ncbi:MAG: MMPL family transporter, partial [Dehalococcoidia bacterium]
MFSSLGRFSFDQRRWVVAGALIFFVVSAFGSRGIVDSLEQGGFFDQSSEAAKTSQLLADLGIGLSDVDLVLVFDAGEESIRDIDNLLEIRDIENAAYDTGAFDGRPRSYRELGSNSFLSADGTKTVSFFSMSGSDTEKRERYATEVRPVLESERLEILRGGTVPGAIELNELIESSIGRGELISLPLSFGLLFLVFGGFVAAGLPLVAGVVAVVGALAVTRVVATLTDMSAFVVMTVTMLGLGVTIDYSLFMVNRYREEMARSGDDVRRAVERTVATAGRSVAFSGITTVLSMGSLLFFNEMIFRSFAFGAMAAVLVAFVNAVILLPALIAVFGVNAGRTAERGTSRAPWAVARWLGRVALFRLSTGFDRFPRTGGEVSDHGFWFRVASLGRRWPWPLAGGVLAILIVAGLPFLRLNISLPDHRVLPPSSETRRVVDEIEKAFPDRDTRPVKLALTFDEGRAPAHYDEIASYTERLLAVPGVRAVTSLTTIDLLERELVLDYESGVLDELVAGGLGVVLSLFANGPTTLVDVSLEPDAQSVEAQRVLEDVRAVPPPPASSVQIGGDTAQLVDTKASLTARVPWVIAYIMVVTFV